MKFSTFDFSAGKMSRNVVIFCKYRSSDYQDHKMFSSLAFNSVKSENAANILLFIKRFQYY